MSEPTQHTVQPDEPWWHPHHLMHHGGTIVTGASIIAVALISLWARKRRASKG